MVARRRARLARAATSTAIGSHGASEDVDAERQLQPLLCGGSSVAGGSSFGFEVSTQRLAASHVSGRTQFSSVEQARRATSWVEGPCQVVSPTMCSTHRDVSSHVHVCLPHGWSKRAQSLSVSHVVATHVSPRCETSWTLPGGHSSGLGLTASARACPAASATASATASTKAPRIPQRSHEPRRAARWASALAFLALVGCDRAPRCPAGFSPDAARTRRVTALLLELPEAAPLVSAAEPFDVCWGEVSLSVLDDRRCVRLDRRLGDPEAAARLGHLLLHLREGVPLAEGCDARALALAEDRERGAHALEGRLRAALGVPSLEAGTLEGVLSDYRDRCASR